MAGVDRFGQPVELFGARDIDPQRIGAAPGSNDFACDGLGAGKVDVGDHHGHAQFAGAARQPRADPGPCAGDHRNPGREQFCSTGHLSSPDGV